MSDVIEEGVNYDKKGNISSVHIRVGGKKMHFSRNGHGEIVWHLMEGLGEPHPYLVRRAKRKARSIFTANKDDAFCDNAFPQRFFVRPGPMEHVKKNVIMLTVYVVCPDSMVDPENPGVPWPYYINIRTGKMFMRPLSRCAGGSPFNGKELRAMWSVAERKLKKERDRILFSRQQKDMFADAK